MKTLKEKFQDYLKKKSLWGKISDVIFIVFIVAMFIPNSRMAIAGFVNRIKSMVIQPSVNNNNTQTIGEINWQLTDVNGSTVNFNDFKGKVIFLNFWATWCPPCVGEMPSIQNLYSEFKDNKNIVFLLVSRESTDKIKAFTSNKNYTFPVYSNKFSPPNIFASNSIPTTFVISKNGVIKVKEKGAANWGGDKMKKIITDLINE